MTHAKNGDKILVYIQNLVHVGQGFVLQYIQMHGQKVRVGKKVMNKYN